MEGVWGRVKRLAGLLTLALGVLLAGTAEGQVPSDFTITTTTPLTTQSTSQSSSGGTATGAVQGGTTTTVHDAPLPPSPSAETPEPLFEGSTQPTTRSGRAGASEKPSGQPGDPTPKATYVRPEANAAATSADASEPEGLRSPASDVLRTEEPAPSSLGAHVADRTEVPVMLATSGADPARPVAGAAMLAGVALLIAPALMRRLRRRPR